MKNIRFLCATFLPCFLLLAGCSNSPTPAAANFTIVPDYGSPGAYSIDTLTNLSGVTYSGFGCDPQSDPNCHTSFGPVRANATSTPPGYTEVTDAVGNVEWNVGGTTSNNCAGGYPNQIITVSTETSYPLVCASPTTDFTSSDPSWYFGQQPSSVTFTAVNSKFPTQNFSAATTVYDTSANVQWSGTVVSSTITTITVPISNTAVGTHILVFRNPSNNAVIGSSAYVVFANPNGGPGGCKHQPCSQSQN